MKVVTFADGAAERLGVLVGNEIVDLARAAGGNGEGAPFADMLSFIRAGASARTAAEALIDSGKGRTAASGVKLLAPLKPSTILCSGSNYHAHNAEKKDSAISGKEPEFFVKTADCVVGPDEPILYDPKLSEKLDCETELAVVIGAPGRHIPVERALDHVFGYTIVNDVTARDRQVRTNDQGFTWYELGRGKAFDSSAPLGPTIVTADEVPDPQNLWLKTRINGELRQSSNTSDMIWSCAELIHFFSTNFTLRPGMVIITGTPAGTAWSTDASLGGKWRGEPGLVPATRYCLPGDVIECEMEKIGLLRNPVAAA
ncbi:fumarylacetoacetate hydrolase family protein [Aquabacter sp. CN5-332]|uniref:fumarylacetoacetate hydrolase family protein n=1 Tax=Aquabacter sp. CN5-332 TaxID=3156608 RepID=UPI0032B52EFD